MNTLETLFGLHGRHALVTGSSSGIGHAAAILLAGAGATVTGADLTPAPSGSPVEGVIADVTNEVDVLRCVQHAEQQHGPVSILVNAAGRLSSAALPDLDPAEWDRTIDVDLRSVYLVTRAVLPSMVAQGFGRVINVSSQLAQIGAAGMSAYAAAKAGVIGFSKSVAREVARAGVTVNVIAPGPVWTPMMDDVNDEWKKDKQQQLPLGRFGRPEEVAPTILLLASTPGGNLYVGQTLGPNSGDVMA